MKFVQDVLSVKIHTEYVVWAVPWLRHLVTVLSSRTLGFGPRPV